MTTRLAILLAFGLALPAAAAPPPAIPYPAGYRHWMHVTSMVIYSDAHPLFAQFGGMHDIYVNQMGAGAVERNGSFPDGSVLVLDLHEAKEDGGTYVAGPRKVLAVMVKNRKLYQTTGGWGFQAFKDDSHMERMVTNPTEQCFGCHEQQRSHDFVFSTYRP